MRNVDKTGNEVKCQLLNVSLSMFSKSGDEPYDSADWDEPLMLAYEENASVRLALPLSASDRETLRLWLQQILRMNRCEAAFYIRRSVQMRSFFLNIADKANFLCQTAVSPMLNRRREPTR